jgi:type II secretory pathway predicted ATPase ExeA
MDDGQRAMTSECAHGVGRVESLDDPAATADELIGLLGYDVLAFHEAQRRARCVLQGVIRALAGVQARFADGHVAIVDEPFTIGGDRATVAQGVGDEVIGNHAVSIG